MNATRVPPAVASGEVRANGRPAVLIGRSVAAVSIGLAVSGLLALILVGRVDHIARGYVAHLALPAIGLGALGWVAFPRQPDNRAVWVVAWAALCTALGAVGWAWAVLLSGAVGIETSFSSWQRLSPADLPPAAALGWDLTFVGAVPGYFSVLTLGLLLGPDGALPSPRWRWVGGSAVLVIALLTVVLTWGWRPGITATYGSDSSVPTGGLSDPIFLLMLTLAAISCASIAVRYRRSAGTARDQVRWLGMGTGALLATFVALTLAELVPGLGGDWKRVAYLFGLAALITCYGIAVTRYRLYDIDVVVSRALTYGALAVFIGGVYVGVVVVVGGLAGAGAGDLRSSIVAMAIAAVGFAPVQRWAHHRADRLVYGSRATPYEVLSDLIRRLAGAESGHAVLARMTRRLAAATGATQATIWLRDGALLTVAAAWPPVRAPRTAGVADRLAGDCRPILDDGEPVGVLQVIEPPGGSITPAEDQLLLGLAASAGLIVSHERLVASLRARADDLRRSRRRLLETEDEERRRMELDLRLGVRQQLEGLAAKLTRAEATLGVHGADEAAALVQEASRGLEAAIEEITAFARGIDPPLLRSDGLAAALRAQLADLPIRVELATEIAGRPPVAVETALYLAVLEAVVNAIKHGQPSHIDVRVRASRELVEAEVGDDGTGFDVGGARWGFGLGGIRDRIEAFDGTVSVRSSPGAGTTLTFHVPLRHRRGDVGATERPVVGVPGRPLA